MKKNRLLILVLVILLIVANAGCSKTISDNGSNPDSTSASGSNEVPTPLSYENIPTDNGLLQGSESICYVGLGYNILESTYMDPLSFTLGNYILNPDEVQKRLKTGSPNKKTSETIIGTSVFSYSNELMSKLELSAKYPLFSGKIESEYNSTLSNQSNVYFIKSISGYISHSEYLPNTSLKDLRGILDPVFEEDLNSDMTPELLFQKYGTHLLRESLMGARCTMNFTYIGSKTDTTTSVETKVHAAYSYFDGTATGSVETQASELISKSHFKSILTGGMDIDASSIGKLKENFADWIATLRDYPPTIFGISNINSLIPIWDLTENKERAKQLEDYFNSTGVSVREKLEEMSKIPPEIDQTQKEYIESIVITSDKNQDKAKKQNDYASKGYILLDKDLNKGAGGNYIYIWYKKTTDPNKALTDIRFTYGDFGDIPSFYTKNPIDLNAGAGGRHIYMWTTTRSSIGKPITAIDVFYGKNANMPVGYDVAGVNYYKDGKNTRETAELNCEAGGEYIYLGISKQ